jgi:Ca2+-binding RTX toxin-like protein
MAEFYGTKKKDVFGGTDGEDIAFGAGGRDTLSGQGGADVLVGEAGADTLDGGEGDDILSSGAIDPDFQGFLSPGVSYDTDREKDRLSGGAGDDYLFAGVGDVIDGGESGSYGNRLYISFMGANEGVSADFRLLWDHDVVKIAGGTIRNIQNIGFLEGSDFDDFLVPIDTGYPSGPAVYGRGGNDHIIADYYSGWGGGLYGGDGDDEIDATGASYGPKIFGEDGDDVLRLRSSLLDTGYGGAGDDTITGGGSVYGGDGDDVITLLYNVYGARAWGDAGNDTISGGDTGDAIYGGAGNDAIGGGGGDDMLSGDTGRDTLSGGAGADTFVFATGDLPSQANKADRIVDFNRKDGDTINLAAIDAKSDTIQVDHFKFVGTAAFSGTAGELRFGFAGGATLIEGDTDGDGVGDVFLRLDGEIALVAKDFELKNPVSAAALSDAGTVNPHAHAVFDALASGLALA